MSTSELPAGIIPPRHRRLDGFTSSKSARYTGISPAVSNMTKKVAKTTHAIDENTRILHFSIKTASNEMIRFPENPFLFYFTIEYRQAAGPDPAVIPATAWTPLVNNTPDRVPWYLSEFLGASAFIQSCDVTVDNVPIENPSINMHLYTALEMLFCSDVMRKQKYGESFVWPSNQNDLWFKEQVPLARFGAAHATVEALDNAIRPAAALAVRVVGSSLKHSPTLTKLMKTLQNEIAVAAAPADLEVKCLTGNCHGVFPFSTQNNTLRTITKQAWETSFLAQGMEICTTLQLMNPITAFIERADVINDEYFTGVALTRRQDNARTEELRIRIKKVELTYESIILESNEKVKRCKAYFDFPYMRISNITPHIFNETVHVPIPEHSRLVYICFISEFQINLNARAVANQTGQFLSCRFRFPPNLKHLSVSLTDCENLLPVKEGLVDLGIANKIRQSTPLRLLHSDMVRKRTYQKAFDDYVPPRIVSAGGLVQDTTGFDQALYIDLIPHCKAITKATEMTIELTWEAGSPEHLYLFAFPVQQREISFDQDRGWAYKIVSEI